MKPTAKRESEPAAILAFGAHPDDIEFGCGGVIALETLAGRPAHFVICTRGESASRGAPRRRAAEARRAARILGATLEWVILGPDAGLEPRPALAARLAAVIRRVRPAVIMAPTLAPNQHPDHPRLGALVREAARLARYGGVARLRSRPAHAAGALLAYAVTEEAEPEGAVPVLIDISAPRVMAAWEASMRAHASQAATRGYAELQLARARVFGLRAGVGHAQALFPGDPPVLGSLAALASGARRF